MYEQKFQSFKFQMYVGRLGKEMQGNFESFQMGQRVGVSKFQIKIGPRKQVKNGQRKTVKYNIKR